MTLSRVPDHKNFPGHKNRSHKSEGAKWGKAAKAGAKAGKALDTLLGFK